jgi:hypothetical protein
VAGRIKKCKMENEAVTGFHWQRATTGSAWAGVFWVISFSIGPDGLSGGIRQLRAQETEDEAVVGSGESASTADSGRHRVLYAACDVGISCGRGWPDVSRAAGVFSWKLASTR